MAEPIYLIVRIEVKSGQREKQINLYKKLAPLVLAESGCLQYELKAVVEDENQFVLLEKWKSEAALAAHDVTKHMIEADAYSPTFRAKPAQVLRLISIDS